MSPFSIVQITISDPSSYLLWVLFYVGLGFSLSSILISTGYFVAIVRNKVHEEKLSRVLAETMNVVLYIFDCCAFFGVAKVIGVLRAPLAHSEVANIALLGFVIGVIAPLMAHGILNRDKIVIGNT